MLKGIKIERNACLELRLAGAGSGITMIPSWGEEVTMIEGEDPKDDVFDGGAINDGNRVYNILDGFFRLYERGSDPGDSELKRWSVMTARSLAFTQPPSAAEYNSVKKWNPVILDCASRMVVLDKEAKSIAIARMMPSDNAAEQFRVGAYGTYKRAGFRIQFIDFEDMQTAVEDGMGEYVIPIMH